MMIELGRRYECWYQGCLDSTNATEWTDAILEDISVIVETVDRLYPMGMAKCFQVFFSNHDYS